ncbi:hypothetical protein INT48_001712 [Thamnidium elegans]|uniref:Uncharacterized protein n=1 Tax=Thamnidium elegans TaxID=101142 RepID=A0A8H7SSC0_9FUNG|nr:hypothetical protein INT48_001712 [Thamnidium elegans]
MSKDNYITYDKHKLNVLSWGDQSVDDNEEDTVQIDVSGKKLYQLFENGKDRWDQDDLFTLTAVSDFIRLYVEKLIEDSKGEIKDSGALHYVLVVPSEWEEEIREVLIRPIFVQANLISKDEHQDRLLFCSEIESVYYYLSDYFTEMIRNTILGRIVAVEENQVSIRLDLILTGNPLFDFSGSVTRPKIMNSKETSLTSDDVKNGIREFIKIKFSFNAQESTILNIMKALGNYTFISAVSNRDEEEASYLMQPFITDENISELDKHQEKLIRSIRPFDICAEISKHLPNNLEQLLPNSLVKEYSIVKFTDEYTSEIKSDDGLLQWSRFMFEYNRISFDSNFIVPKNPLYKSINNNSILHWASRYSIDAIQNSNIYGRPRILSTEHSAISSSIFLNSKPDAIMNIDVLLDSTVLSFSLLDGNGLVKEIWNHDYFVPDIGLRSLGLFFTFSEVATLNVKNSFAGVNTTAITESGSDHEDQETIVSQEEIIHIPNIYDSLCFNMWNNITENSSLIQLCDTHKGHNDNELLDIFSLENQAEFMNNLKEYISKDILNKNLTTQKAEKTAVYLKISFRPVIQDIISLVFTSLINKQLFGSYRDIQYVFHLICFNYNPQFQHILMKVLDEETDYFMYEQRIDVDHYTIPKLPNQLIQPILGQEPCSYKGFRVVFFKLKPVASLNFDEPISLEHTTEKFGDQLHLNDFTAVILHPFILKLKRLETRLNHGIQQYLRNP